MAESSRKSSLIYSVPAHATTERTKTPSLSSRSSRPSSKSRLSNDKTSGQDKKHRKPSLSEEAASRASLTSEKSWDIPTVPTLSRRLPSKKKYSAEKSSTEASKASHKCKAAVLLAVALLLLLLGALLVAYFFTSGTNTNNVVVCRTDDCAAFGRELSAAINVAIDPCHDFHSYVCGSWDDQSRQESTEGRMRVAALNAALKEIRDSPDTKAAHFYDSCHSAVADLKENLRLFAEFRKSLGLTWPERSVQGG
ncbi:hypothetical protein MRX96_040417 [Rhipicephalus microplus]